MDDMIGLIPAAGKGMRLGLPYPKELYPVIRDNRYKPIAQFVVENLTAAGLQQIVFVINETKHQLIGYFGNGHRFGCHFTYAVQEGSGDEKNSSPGLAHALDAAYFQTREKVVFFGMADTIMQPVDLYARAFQACEKEDELVLILFPTDRPQKFGMVRYDQDFRVQEVVDKPKQTELREMWGGMIWRPRFTEHLHECVENQKIGDFAEVMNRAIRLGMPVKAARMPNGSYLDLGTYDEIMELDRRYRG